MLTIAKLFGKSPFAPLQSHMEKVSSCMKKLMEIFHAFEEDKQDQIASLVKELSKLEHEADLTKNDIRNHLPKSIFLPIDRGKLLKILAIQDDLADKAEEIGHLLTLYPLKKKTGLHPLLKELLEQNLEAFWLVRGVIKEMNDLVESSFGGTEAERVKSMIDSTSFKEYEADKKKHKIIREIFSQSEDLNSASFYLYMRLAEEINHLSHISEQLANLIRIVIDVK